MIYKCHLCGREYDIQQAGQYECECGNVFSVSEADLSPARIKPMETKESSQEQTETQICPYCKSTIPVDAVKCCKCGEWLNGKPKSRGVYLLLTFLFGNWGIGEFYAGRKGYLGIIYFFSNLFFLVYSIRKKESFLGCFLIWVIALIVSFCSNTGTIKSKSSIEKDKKSTRLWLDVFIILITVIFLLFMAIASY